MGADATCASNPDPSSPCLLPFPPLPFLCVSFSFFVFVLYCGSSAVPLQMSLSLPTPVPGSLVFPPLSSLTQGLEKALSVLSGMQTIGILILVYSLRVTSALLLSPASCVNLCFTVATLRFREPGTLNGQPVALTSSFQSHRLEDFRGVTGVWWWSVM